ncbi:MAG: RecQ family ATP-dependent DNA helicase [Lentimicrobiaceae bacterium]
MEVAKGKISISFIDIEVQPATNKVLDFGCVRFNDPAGLDHAELHSSHLTDFINFIKNTDFLCGHNLFSHDLKYLTNIIPPEHFENCNFIDTLLYSPLLFSTRPYHHLLKDDKINSEELNNPLNDSLSAKDLLFDEILAFKHLDAELRSIYYELLGKLYEWKGFFNYVNYQCSNDKSMIEGYSSTEDLIIRRFSNEICENSNLTYIIRNKPVELAYCLALINAHDRYSITPPWVLKSYPEVEKVMVRLRNKPCITGCPYCDIALDIHQGLKKFFGFNSYRSYAGEPLQEKAVKAAVDGNSLLAVFPTGGGKSLTFQVPALMSGESAKGLTVVISPLQSLMKDQVDNLEKAGITEAVTINGLLDPIERAKSIERIVDGSASILYIAPESLRSKTLEHILLGRKIVRFVVDEAHCFSSWGQDFRVDYLYIGDFIKSLQQKKNLTESIPVSCFTATAKQKVIDDICQYFKEKLDIDLEIFSSKASRTNLRYQVFERGNEEEKYHALRSLLDEKDCPTIVYVSRTRRAYELATRLSKDGYIARPYHGKMDPIEKSENQNEFIAGNVDIMVATSAFGMGVDKKDVGMVIHYDISDSLENYVQEAGRAGRDESIYADCYVLFNENDLDKHFILLNQTKLNIKEIQQVWKAIKEITRLRATVSNSALEIARKAGWDDGIKDIETRVTTAIAALEDAGYIKRGQNSPRIFANSILSRTAQEAIDKINASTRFNEKDKQSATRIIKNLIAAKNRKAASDEVAESRVDYLAENLGMVKGEVIRIINLLREEKILADNQDLSAYIRRGESKNQSIRITDTYSLLEKFLINFISQEEKIFHLKELNEKALQSGIDNCTPNKIKTIFNFWAIKNWIKRQTTDYQNNRISVLGLIPESEANEKQEKRHNLARYIIDFLYNRSTDPDEDKDKEEILVHFSVHELKEAYNNRNELFKIAIDISDVEDALFYLSRIEALKIDGGFLVVYNKLTIERLESNLRKQYKTEDYQKLSQFYENKVQQIHIVGEYAKKMITDYTDALQFVEDYFRLNYQSFLNKYFKGSRQAEISRNITHAKFNQLFGELSATQLAVINDQTANYIVVAAGPGSGKTKLLVHKLASLIYMEDVKYEQLLMLTFSRAAATEFKKRLFKLIGDAAAFVQITTFHSYCFDLLGKIGTLEKSYSIISDAIEKIRNGDIEPNSITKTVLVVDEAQDMNGEEYELIKTLMEFNEGMRVIAVGDDDQNIFEFRKSSSKYLTSFINDKQAIVHELLTNFRSRNNLVEFSNQFANHIRNRLKRNPIHANSVENGFIKLISHEDNNLAVSLVKDFLQTELRGTTCVLTKTNDEALQVTALLLKNRINARLIQSNEGFNLYNLHEVRYFLDKLDFFDSSRLIREEEWNEAKRKLLSEFGSSPDLEICKKMVKDFETIHSKKKYKTDFEIFIKESKLEDFITANGEVILVSTMHKSKGREFDNVFLMLQNYAIQDDEDSRLLYVAMTRAKENLTIHYNINPFDQSLERALRAIKVPGLQRYHDEANRGIPNELVMQPGFKDVWLDYFAGKQYQINRLKSGDPLKVTGTDGYDLNGRPILKFSREFSKTIDTYQHKGYKITKCTVNHIIYWIKEGTENEIKIVLPEVWFEKDK